MYMIMLSSTFFTRFPEHTCFMHFSSCFSYGHLSGVLTDIQSFQRLLCMLYWWGCISDVFLGTPIAIDVTIPSVFLSVCHICALCPNGRRYHRSLFCPMSLPDRVKIWFTNPFLLRFRPKVTHPCWFEHCRHSITNCGRIVIEIAQWLQWRAYRKPTSLFRMVYNPYDLPVSQNWDLKCTPQEKLRHACSLLANTIEGMNEISFACQWCCFSPYYFGPRSSLE